MASEIAYSLSNLLDAVRERDEARAGCDHSWGHFGYRYEERVKKAVESFESDIRAIVRQELEQHGK